MDNKFVAKELVKMAKSLNAANLGWSKGQNDLNYIWVLLSRADERIEKFTRELNKYKDSIDALQISEEITSSWIPDINQQLKELSESLASLKKAAEKLG